ncbi:MAG: hypothetical protein K5905_30100, partial [Roseibium sp.]|uniref:imm11 family protein n=1 Tax=Roseibium sp. TaxID=1936156 RepID=UPI00263464B0
MPWYLDELGRSDEIEWHFAEDQNIPDTIVLAKTIPDPKSWPLKVIQTGYVEDRGQSEIPDFTVGPVLGTVVVSRRFKRLVEQFDPEKHHFIPLEIHRPDGEVWCDT